MVPDPPNDSSSSDGKPTFRSQIRPGNLLHGRALNSYLMIHFGFPTIKYISCPSFSNNNLLSFVEISFYVLLFLHFGRGISYASYLYNPNTWFSGIIILFFLMGTAFMGYVLPFGQMSFWGATVITNLLSPFPSLIEFICGGHYIYNPTLKRFFIFHFVFPFLLCGFPSQAKNLLVIEKILSGMALRILIIISSHLRSDRPSIIYFSN